MKSYTVQCVCECGETTSPSLLLSHLPKSVVWKGFEEGGAVKTKELGLYLSKGLNLLEG